MPDSLAWKAENAELAEMLGRPAPQPPGINIAAVFARQRDALAPQSMTEITAETFAMNRRAIS
jgi:hypothetical protein